MKNRTSKTILLNLLGWVMLLSVACKKRDIGGLQDISFPKNGNVFICLLVFLHNFAIHLVNSCISLVCCHKSTAKSPSVSTRAK